MSTDGIKQTSTFSKQFVLITLFALPLIAYLFFLQGKHNFDTLPIVTKEVIELDQFKTLKGNPVQLQDSVSIITFLGNDPYSRLGYISNLNEKIYRDFHEFDTFQMISVVPQSSVETVQEIVNQMSTTTDVTDWHFITASDREIDLLYNSFKSTLELNTDTSSDYAFVIDKNRALRGRSGNDNDEENAATVYGYDTSSVAALNKVMIDDIRILLAEYRFAFKKNRDEKIKGDE